MLCKDCSCSLIFIHFYVRTLTHVIYDKCYYNDVRVKNPGRFYWDILFIAMFLACTCPSPVNVIAYASSNFGSTAVQYTQPRPTCSSTLKTAPATKQSGSKFVVGKHSLDYVYSTIGGFDLTCRVNIDVRGEWSIFFVFDDLCLLI